MQCLAPVYLKNEKRHLSSAYATNKVGCGRCPPCVKKRVQQWQLRLEQEQMVSASSCFLTLTYDAESLPFTGDGLQTLKKKDWQDFMKRLRKKDTSTKLALGEWKWKYWIDKDGKEKRRKVPKIPLKYYAVGEYGSTYGRPHYHAILFNLPPEFLSNSEHLHNIWGKGRIQIDPCTPASIGYVAGYVMKKSTVDEKYIHEKQLYCHFRKKYLTEISTSWNDPTDTREPEWSTMSKHLGVSYMSEAMIKYHKETENNYVTKRGGTKIALPRYYKERIFNEHEQIRLSIQARAQIENQPEFEGTEKVRLERIQNEFRKTERKIRKQREKF